MKIFKPVFLLCFLMQASPLGFPHHLPEGEIDEFAIRAHELEHQQMDALHPPVVWAAGIGALALIGVAVYRLKKPPCPGS